MIGESAFSYSSMSREERSKEHKRNWDVFGVHERVRHVSRAREQRIQGARLSLLSNASINSGSLCGTRIPTARLPKTKKAVRR
jgi:hypothetical protein